MSKRARSTPPPDSIDTWLTNERGQIDAFVAEVLEHMGHHGFSESSRFAVRLALEEGVSNAFRHGHKGMPASTPVHVRSQVGEDELRVTIIDQGPGFKPEDVPDPTLDENLERPSGRGLMLIRSYMTSVKFGGRGNEMTMTYRKPARG